MCRCEHCVHTAVAQDVAGMTPTVLQCTTSMQEAPASMKGHADHRSFAHYKTAALLD